MHLSKNVLKELIEKQNLITNHTGADNQLTANGFDVRLAAVIEILDGGKLAIEKSNNKNPKLGKAFVLKGFESRLKGYDIKELIPSEIITLKKLQPYFAVTCEELNTPNNLMFHINPRSSLFRITQSLLGHGFGEAGYKGFLTFMLLPFLDSEIELGSRFAQLSFSELKGEANYEEQKNVNHQGGKLF